MIDAVGKVLSITSHFLKNWHEITEFHLSGQKSTRRIGGCSFGWERDIDASSSCPHFSTRDGGRGIGASAWAAGQGATNNGARWYLAMLIRFSKVLTNMQSLEVKSEVHAPIKPNSLPSGYIEMSGLTASTVQWVISHTFRVISPTIYVDEHWLYYYIHIEKKSRSCIRTFLVNDSTFFSVGNFWYLLFSGWFGCWNGRFCPKIMSDNFVLGDCWK